MTTTEPLSASIGGDLILRVLIDLLEADPRNRMDLTVTVAGGTITGSAVGRDTWLARFAATTKAAGIGQPVSVGEMIQAALPAVTAAVEFLHMMDARFVSGGILRPTAGHDGFLWRAPVDEVSSWALGALT